MVIHEMLRGGAGGWGGGGMEWRVRGISSLCVVIPARSLGRALGRNPISPVSLLVVSILIIFPLLLWTGGDFRDCPSTTTLLSTQRVPWPRNVSHRPSSQSIDHSTMAIMTYDWVWRWIRNLKETDRSIDGWFLFRGHQSFRKVTDFDHEDHQYLSNLSLLPLLSLSSCVCGVTGTSIPLHCGNT